jgi:hypothetical protein
MNESVKVNLDIPSSKQAGLVSSVIYFKSEPIQLNWVGSPSLIDSSRSIIKRESIKLSVFKEGEVPHFEKTIATIKIEKINIFIFCSMLEIKLIPVSLYKNGFIYYIMFVIVVRLLFIY